MLFIKLENPVFRLLKPILPTPPFPPPLSSEYRFEDEMVPPSSVGEVEEGSIDCGSGVKLVDCPSEGFKEPGSGLVW